MKRVVKINNKEYKIKTREPFAQKEKVVKSKKVYDRKKLKKELNKW
jgi:hypothetical protein